jgi:cephalosporin hydroxylase
MLNEDLSNRKEDIVNDFHKLYYDHFEQTWEQTWWKGIKVLKCPLDLWIYQEIIWEQKPSFIIETGTAHGGSAYFLADLVQLLGLDTKVITIDIEGAKTFPNRPYHEKIEYILGSSVDKKTIEKITNITNSNNNLVILDSAHKKEHVFQEINLYKSFVPIGGYLIVEDTNVHGHPVALEHPEGPMEAVDQYMSDHDDLVIDQTKEKFYLTFNPKGFLKRVK